MIMFTWYGQKLQNIQKYTETIKESIWEAISNYSIPMVPTIMVFIFIEFFYIFVGVSNIYILQIAVAQ